MNQDNDPLPGASLELGLALGRVGSVAGSTDSGGYQGNL